MALRHALGAWLTIALNSFGGPAGQIAVMHRVLVETRGWVSERRFLHALNYCMLLPGPEAQQLSVYLGWLLHGTWGALIAGSLFVLPGFLAILALSVLYAGWQDVTIVEAVFFGLKPAVLAIVGAAVIRVARRSLTTRALVATAVGAFVALFLFGVPFPIVIGAAALGGWLVGRWQPHRLEASRVDDHASPGVPGAGPGALLHDDEGIGPRPSSRRTLLIVGIGGLLWLGPVVLLVALLGPGDVYADQALFFSGAAVVTFGGAYAVLTFVAQQAVQVFGWLTPGEMLDGLALAETTPGPLIMVVEYVGFLAAYRQPGTLDPMLAGFLGAVLVTWVTFVPSFLWVLAGAPYSEYLRGDRRLRLMLTTITAAVVGAILNLAVWFGLHTLFGVVEERVVGPLHLWLPDPATVDPIAVVIAIGAFVGVFRLRLPMLVVLAASAAAGAVAFLVLGR